MLSTVDTSTRLAAPPPVVPATDELMKVVGDFLFENWLEEAFWQEFAKAALPV